MRQTNPCESFSSLLNVGQRPETRDMGSIPACSIGGRPFPGRLCADLGGPGKWEVDQGLETHGESLDPANLGRDPELSPEALC